MGLMNIPFSTIILREAKSGMDFYFNSTFFWGVSSLAKARFVLINDGLCHVIKFFDGMCFWLCIEDLLGINTFI